MLVKITKVSGFTGQTHTKEFEMTEAQLYAYRSGEGSIQNIFPELSASDREFLITGVTQEEWDAAFGESEEV